MIKSTRVELNRCIIHKVGNKYNSGQNAYSNTTVKFDEESYESLLSFLMKPFRKVVQSYRFTHHADVRFNEINKYSDLVFKDSTEDSFIDQSVNIADHLYNQSNSAQIKRGDLLICHFENIEYKDMLVEAVGVFKIENKSDFFQTYQEDESYDIALTKGISTSKLDKGCLVLNTRDTEGTVVLSVDNNNYDAQYWINNFLQVQLASDKNLHTKNYLEMCRDFSEEIIKPEFGKQEQISFLANTVNYFKENENADYHDFKDVIFEQETTKEKFEEYKQTFEKTNDVLIRNNFDVSEEVLKKIKPKLKTDIKLDTNIKVSLDIDDTDAPSEYLEQGYDEDKKMKFYKVFYNEES